MLSISGGQNLPDSQKSLHSRAFFWALGISGAIFLPLMVYNSGYFLYGGDFNVQQISFYMVAHRAVRSLDLLWSPVTDLGANFIGSYSFYLLGSPFFWLTVPFPESVVPRLMAPLLMLKLSLASMFAYFYIARFVKSKQLAVTAGLLYAFSGWSVFNIFFNHFHDVMVFFPLLLIALEELVQNNRRVCFALMVALCAIVNYWFFIGEVVFVVIYFFVRMTSPDFKPDLKRFAAVAFEAVLGVALSAFIVLPSALAIMGNPRTTPDNLLLGWDFWVYWHGQRPFAIIQSLFFPPEPVSRPNFFPDHGAQWSSLSAWLPLFSLSGVWAFMTQARKNWLKTMLAVSALMALFPGLNSLFILLNNSYYARWFFMPLLLMCVATVAAIERPDIDIVRGIKACGVVCAGIILAVGLTPKRGDEGLRIGLFDNLLLFIVYSLLTVVFLLIAYYIFRYKREDAKFLSILNRSLAAVIIVFTIFHVCLGKNYPDKERFFIGSAIEGRGKISLPSEGFERIDVYNGTENMGLFWNLPSLHTFHSIVPVSLMEFYPSVGVKRDVSSKPEPEYYALRAFLSARWLFIQQDEEQQEPMPGYSFFEAQNGFNIYENENYIPMAFCYDSYMTEELWKKTAVGERGKLLLRAVLLSDEQIERHSDILSQISAPAQKELTYDEVARDAQNRRESAATGFEFERGGMFAEVSLPKESLVFFSVPYDDGWRALVDGEAVEIERVNVGFMAVRAPAGEHRISFRYMPGGLAAGAAIAGTALAVLVLYAVLDSRKKRAEER